MECYFTNLFCETSVLLWIYGFEVIFAQRYWEPMLFPEFSRHRVEPPEARRTENEPTLLTWACMVQIHSPCEPHIPIEHMWSSTKWSETFLKNLWSFWKGEYSFKSPYKWRCIHLTLPAKFMCLFDCWRTKNFWFNRWHYHELTYA